MTFKNQKEEVIEIELTSYGKYLLSKGKFKPEYYAFYDDDVLYDAEYGGEAEEQNYAQTRILEETPRTRVQTVFSGIETEVKKQIEEARANKRKIKNAFQTTKEKHYALSMPLGNSSVSSDYAPSWDTTIYGAEFAEQLSVSKGDHQTMQIPQMNLDEVTYIAEVVESEEDPLSKQLAPSADSQEFPNGTTIEVSDGDFIIEIDELHTDSLRENYEIEFYIVDEDTVDGNDVETLIPLSFQKRFGDRIVNGILLDSEETPTAEIDETYVEYYFDVEVDLEIDKNRLCKLGYVTDFSKRGHININCQDGISVSTEMTNIYRDLGRGIPIQGDDC